MIPKQFKVPRSKIDYILSKGALKRSEFFIIRYSQNDDDFPGFCVIISKKIDKSAVKRNKLKRQIFEIIRLHLENRKKSAQQTNYDVILIPKKSILTKSYGELDSDIKKLLKHLKIING